MRREASYVEVQRRCAAFVRQALGRHAEKQLMSALDVSEATAERILAGRVSAENLTRLSRRLGPSFVDFVFDKAPPALAPERSFWITGIDVEPAPAGLDIAARLYLKRSPAEGVDFAEIGRRNLGWVSAVTGPGRVALRCHAGADPAALQRAADWLSGTVAGTAGAEINGVAMDSLEALAELTRLARGAVTADAADDAGWDIERRNLDGITAPHLLKLLKARAEAGDAPGTLPALLSRTGLLPYAAIFQRRRDGATRTHFQGDRLGVNPAECIGRLLSERSHHLYADLLASRLETARVETTFHRLRLCTAGHWWDYDSVAVADRPAPDGRQDIATVVNIRQRVAA